MRPASTRAEILPSTISDSGPLPVSCAAWSTSAREPPSMYLHGARACVRGGMGMGSARERREARAIASAHAVGWVEKRTRHNRCEVAVARGSQVRPAEAAVADGAPRSHGRTRRVRVRMHHEARERRARGDGRGAANATRGRGACRVGGRLTRARYTWSLRRRGSRGTPRATGRQSCTGCAAP